MKFISWNVNGLRACMGKGWQEFFDTADADFFCLQETKLQEGQINLDLPGYEQFWNYAEKKGYSGTAIFAKEAPLSVRLGVGGHLMADGVGVIVGDSGLEAVHVGQSLSVVADAQVGAAARLAGHDQGEGFIGHKADVFRGGEGGHGQDQSQGQQDGEEFLSHYNFLL